MVLATIKDTTKPANNPVFKSAGYCLTELTNLDALTFGAHDYHLPVLNQEVVRHLTASDHGIYVDGTVGEGGHSETLLKAASAPELILGIDLDPRSVDVAQSRLAGFGSRFSAVQGNYADMGILAQEFGVNRVDGVLLDLGFSSRQVEKNGYGLSFHVDEPLDMRYDPNAALTAEFIVNEFQEQELADLIFSLGEERRSRAIARAIVRNRPITSTAMLANLLGSTIGRRPGGRRLGAPISPATRTFQALRIAVNDELHNVERGLESAVGLLAPGGQLAVISYHSLEDRLVKSFMAREAAACLCPPRMPVCSCNHIPRLSLVNRRIIRPSIEEVRSNPRSRSAKLRVAERL